MRDIVCILLLFVLNPDVSTTASPGGNTPPTGQVIKSCDFEDGGAMCGYTNPATNDYNWKITSETTGSQNTGPNNDHTYQTSQGIIAFIFIIC